MESNDASRVLIIEDEFLIALDLRLTIEAMGYEVIGLAIGKEHALTLARNTPPDCIVSDLNLERPGDGAEAVETILAERPVAVVFVTGTPEAVPRTGRLRSAVVLAKPVPPSTLEQALGAAIATHRVHGHATKTALRN